MKIIKIDLRSCDSNLSNWPALHVWVFIAQLVGHCSMNAEATGSNPVEAPQFFFQATSQLLKLQSQLRRSIFISFNLYSHSSHHFIIYKAKGDFTLFIFQVIPKTSLPTLEDWLSSDLPLCPVIVDNKTPIEDAGEHVLQVQCYMQHCRSSLKFLISFAAKTSQQHFF